MLPDYIMLPRLCRVITFNIHKGTLVHENIYVQCVCKVELTVLLPFLFTDDSMLFAQLAGTLVLFNLHCINFDAFDLFLLC